MHALSTHFVGSNYHSVKEMFLQDVILLNISAPGVLELFPVGVEPLVCVQGDSLVRWKVEPEPANDQPALTHTTSLTDPRKIPSHPTPKPD